MAVYFTLKVLVPPSPLKFYMTLSEVDMENFWNHTFSTEMDIYLFCTANMLV